MVRQVLAGILAIIAALVLAPVLTTLLGVDAFGAFLIGVMLGWPAGTFAGVMFLEAWHSR